MNNLLTISDIHSYQKRVIAKGVTDKKSAIFLATGLGKTMIALTIIDQLFKRNLLTGALIVCTKKAMYNQWRQEA